MSKAEKIEFVNRSDELEMLRSRISPDAQMSTVTFLLAPAGYGKSSLTNRLIETVKADGPTCVIVDPGVRSRSRSDRIYAWFFVQRAADPNARCEQGRREYKSFAKFLREKLYRAVDRKHIYENLKEAVTRGKLLRFSVELIENLFKIGRYKPESILQEDSPFAAQIAEDYVRRLAGYRPTLFIVRESQNIDPESLNFFLTLGDDTWQSFVIFEYTNPQSRFSVDHEKIIHETVLDKSSLKTYELHKLNMDDFRFLLRKYALIDRTIEAQMELQWDGNLRIIKALNINIMVGRTAPVSPPLLLDAHRHNLETLSDRRKLVLAVVAVHEEAIRQDVLCAVIQSIDAISSRLVIENELTGLANEERYIRISGDQLSLSDEDLLEAIATSTAIRAMLRKAEVSLREFYLSCIDGTSPVGAPLHQALRQGIALCARTGDIFALRNLIKMLDSTIRQTYDQALYVSIVTETVLGRSDLTEMERRELIDWASGAAYEVNDFPAAIALLENLPNPNAYHIALLACCYGEAGRAEEALSLSRSLLVNSADPYSNIALAAGLIEMVNLAGLGRNAEARVLYSRLRSDKTFAKSALFGFLLRYAEIFQEFPTSTADVLASVAQFRKHGLNKSAAYSQLAAAIFLAFEGRNAAARALVAEAEAELSLHVRDRQTILNNAVVVSLLSSSPDLKWCIEMLNAALFTAKDQYSRLVIQTNRLICYWMLKDYIRATQCADIIEHILAAPTFGHRGVFWPACFNAWTLFTELGNLTRADYFKQIALNLGFDGSADESYWKTRFDIPAVLIPEFEYLMKFAYHPEYLSHWVIDLEGIFLLREANAQ